MSRSRTEQRSRHGRPRLPPEAMGRLEAEIATWPEEEARIGLLVVGSWLAGDLLTLRRAWLRLDPYRIGWLANVMKGIDPGLPTS